MAERSCRSKFTTGRNWKTLCAKAHRAENLKFSPSLLPTGKSLTDIVGPYLDPPEDAVVAVSIRSRRFAFR